MPRTPGLEPIRSASVNENVICTGTEKTTPLGAKRYESPRPPGVVLVTGWMLIVVAAASAPAGIDTLAFPSPALSVPPAGPIVADTAGPATVPKGEPEDGAPPPPPPPQALSVKRIARRTIDGKRLAIPLMFSPLRYASFDRAGGSDRHGKLTTQRHAERRKFSRGTVDAVHRDAAGAIVRDIGEPSRELDSNRVGACPCRYRRTRGRQRSAH